MFSVVIFEVILLFVRITKTIYNLRLTAEIKASPTIKSYSLSFIPPPPPNEHVISGCHKIDRGPKIDSRSPFLS